MRPARRELVRSARALAAAALLALSGALAVPAQAQTCTLNTGDLWCGVVTVASVTGIVVTGDGFSGSEGNLSETGFTYGTNSYTIAGVFIAKAEYDGELFFRLTSALTAADQAKLVLHVDGSSAEFAFSDAVDNIIVGTYVWLDAGLDWSSATSVTLRLRGPPNSAPEFSVEIAVLTVPENSAADTVVGTVTATDADDDTLTYSLEGADAASFDIDSGTGRSRPGRG